MRGARNEIAGPLGGVNWGSDMIWFHHLELGRSWSIAGFRGGSVEVCGTVMTSRQAISQ